MLRDERVLFEENKRLAHLVDELGHVALSVTGVTAFNVTDELLGPPSASGVGKLEGPQEGGGLLEVGSASGDLVNQVFNTCCDKVREWSETDTRTVTCGATYR